MRFLCDAMLGHVGRRLRAAGYDTLIDAGHVSDRELLAKALSEERRLLTCDRGFLGLRKAAGAVIYLAQNDEASWAAHLRRVCHVDWLHAPFTRCLECNEPLTPASAEALSLLPFDTQQDEQPTLYCERCRKVFWHGSHVRRLRERLHELNGKF